MDKLLLYPSFDEHGQHVFPIDLDRPAAIDGLEKTASDLHPEIQTFIDGFKPLEGHTAFLIDALGSELYGENVNGDIFPAEMLAHKGDYGHKTFEKLAYPYYHHINKGERFAYGPKVALSVWHEPMERVQLIAYWRDDKCSDIIDRILGGEIIDVSMGCRVPFDECTFCGNRAKKRSEYCEHLRNDMRRLMPNGVRVAARNWYPKFFDISRVLRGAEKCSKFLMPIGKSFTRSVVVKMAEENYSGMSSAELFEKVASVTGVEPPSKLAEVKEADIEKEIPSNLSAEGQECAGKVLDGMSNLRRMEPDIPKELLDRLGGGFPLKSVLSTMLGMGIFPKPHEFQRIVLISIGKKPLADKMDGRGEVFDEHLKAPQGHDPSMVSCGPRHLSGDIAKMLAPLAGARSCHKPALARRTLLIIKRAQAGDPPFISLPERRRKPISIGALAIGLAALHGAFKQQASTRGLADIGSAARKNPVIFALLTALGIGAVEANRQIQIAGGSTLEKTSAGMSLGTRAIGLPASYIYSDIQKAKRGRGERINWLQHFIANNPDITSLGWIIGAPALYAAGSKNIGKALSMFKGAGLAEQALTYGMFQRRLLPLALTGAAADLVIGNALFGLLQSDKTPITPRAAMLENFQGTA